MYAFYLPRGHTLKDLESLHPIEKNFYIAAQEQYYINLFEVINTVIVGLLGDDSPDKEDDNTIESE